MKKLTLLSIILITISVCADEYRTFTASDGRTLEAKIISFDATSGKVQIERADRKKLTVKSTAFSEKDQAYIGFWQAAQEFMSSSKLKMDLQRNEVKNWKKEHEADMSQVKQGNRDGKQDGVEVIATDKNTQYQYDLALENRGSAPLKNITMEYRVYYEQEKPVKDEEDEKRRKESGQEDAAERVRYNAVNEMKVKNGKIQIKSLDPKEAKEVSTGSVTILKRTVGKPYQSMINLKGSIAGAWVKLTMKDPDGTTLVREIALPASVMGKYSWDMEEKE